MMHKYDHMEIVLVSSGHPALDHRVFDKEAMTLAQHFAHVRVVAAHTHHEEREGIRITALPPVPNRLARFLFRPLQCYLAARGSGPRLLILQDAELLFLAPLVKLLTGWRIVYDVHEDYPQLLLRRTWIPPSVRRTVGHCIGAIEKCFAQCCHGILGATPVLVDYFAPRPRVALYNLPSREFINLAAERARPITEREFDLVHVGTLSDERMDFLTAVFDAVFTRKPSARALVIGVQAYQVERLNQRFPEERLTVLGKVGYDTIAGHLGNCRIGIDVHPVLYPHLRCAVPVKVFEYMAAGCNVVTSYLPELHHLLSDEGTEHVMTIYAPSADAYAEEVVRLLAERESMETHQGALMRLVSTQWNWGYEAEKLIRFITQISRKKEIVTREQVLDR